MSENKSEIRRQRIKHTGKAAVVLLVPGAWLAWLVTKGIAKYKERINAKRNKS